MGNIFNLILQWIIYLSILTTVVVVYLSINKMWSRKHEATVADSISTSAQVISFLTILPFVISYALKHQYGDAFYQFLWLSYTAFLVLTGIGFWVRERQDLNIWQKLSKSVSQDQAEFNNLVKSVGSIVQGKQLLDILHRLAWLDEKLDERELQYVRTLTSSLNLDTDFLEEKPPEANAEKFEILRELVNSYLASRPPNNQAKLLGDLVQSLIRIDNEISPEESIIAAEISGLLDNYLGAANRTEFSLLIHPKSPEQEAQVRASISEPLVSESFGDRALVADTFHTREYAELIGAEYRQRGWFTVIQEIDWASQRSALE